MRVITRAFVCFPLLACLCGGPAAEEYETLEVEPGQRLELASEDPSLALELAVDGGVLAPAGEGFIAPTEGRHWIALAARDEVGHRSPLRWVLLQVKTPPTAVEFRFDPAGAASAENGHWVSAAASATVILTGQRPSFDSVRLRLGAQTVAEENSRFHLPNLGRADQPLVLEGIDRNGEAHVIRSLELQLDDAPPELELGVREGRVADGRKVVVGQLPARVTVRADDRQSGVDRVEWSVAGAEWRAAGDELEVNGASFQVRATDRAGNQLQRSLTVELDVQAPILKVVSSVSGSELSGGGRLLLDPGEAVTLAAEDDGSGVARARYRVDGGAWQEIPATVPLADAGAGSLELEAWDRAGNHSTDRYKLRVSITGQGGGS